MGKKMKQIDRKIKNLFGEIGYHSYLKIEVWGSPVGPEASTKCTLFSLYKSENYNNLNLY